MRKTFFLHFEFTLLTFYLLFPLGSKPFKNFKISYLSYSVVLSSLIENYNFGD